jgi:hypothetical protein
MSEQNNYQAMNLDNPSKKLDYRVKKYSDGQCYVERVNYGLFSCNDSLGYVPTERAARDLIQNDARKELGGNSRVYQRN